MEARMGGNLNGPSLIRVPDWVEAPLGHYYLYFADHRGAYIRLAYADALAGPWRVHPPGTLRLEDSGFPVGAGELAPPSEGLRRLVEAGLLVPHIASPDVHVDEERREIRMYFHGLCADTSQRTRVALSRDGLRFGARPEILAPSYLRMVRRDEGWLGMAMPGSFFRSPDGLRDFEAGPHLLDDSVRHAALLPRGDDLLVFHSRVGDAPERILCSRVDVRGDWRRWRASPPEEVLAPEEPWEGTDLPLTPSVRGYAPHRLRELRDPAVYREHGRTWLLYAVAGESGIALAELELDAA
jgi:hypothetical protein